MDIFVLDEEFKLLGIQENYESVIWTERYSKYGDFEIHTPIEPSALFRLKTGNYLVRNDTDSVMIVEDWEIESDPELGPIFKITGRSLESILDRRIVWNHTLLKGNLQDAIEKVLNENLINPSDPARKIDNFIFRKSTDPSITELEIEAQVFGSDLYFLVTSLCDMHQIGFRILLENGQFIFELYAGKDRSYDQVENPYVIFSPNFENLANSNYLLSSRLLKTTCLVAGEGEGSDQKTVTADSGDGANSGLLRKEMFLDASYISSYTYEGELTPEEYSEQLRQKGLEALAENIFIESFEGQAETTMSFKYGEDFFMGDIVQLENEYGRVLRARVTEVVRSKDVSGVETYPTFTTV